MAWTSPWGAVKIFGFLGPSGAGKSTTQKLLIGLLRGHGGEATVWGRDPLEWGPNYYQRIGVSFELPNHYQKLTGLENLQFFASLYDGETLDPMQLLDAVGLAEDANTRVGKYSKGMQMRLTFIRSLINDPELLFLDEPTSGLDPVNARRSRTSSWISNRVAGRCFSPLTTWRLPTNCVTGWPSSSTARSSRWTRPRS